LTKDVYDLLVIGAGIFGLSSAYHYAKRANNKIIVIDSQSGPGQGNTAKSVGGFRKGLFTSNLNRVLSESTTSFLIDLHNSGYDLGLSQVGYLILLDKDHYEKFIEMVRPIQYKGYATLLSPEELARKIPFINLKFSDDEEAEILGLKDIATALYSPLSGYIDVEKLVNYYYEQLVDMGVEFLFNTKVEKLALKPLNSIGHPREPLAWQKKKFVGAETNKGLIEGDKMVLASGAWINELLDPIGIDAHVKPKKRQIYSIDTTGELNQFFNVEGFNSFNTLPMTFIPRGPFIVPRVREKKFWVGMSDEIGRPWKIDDKPEEHFYYDNILPILSKIFPSLRGARPKSMWAGCYSINTIDENPIIFKELNLIVATGGSGSGVMKSDAIGRIVTALLLNEPVAELYGGERINVSSLGIKGRRVEPEVLVF